MASAIVGKNHSFRSRGGSKKKGWVFSCALCKKETQSKGHPDEESAKQDAIKTYGWKERSTGLVYCQKCTKKLDAAQAVRSANVVNKVVEEIK